MDRLHVLIFDDDVDHAEVMAEFLAMHHHAVAVVHDLDAAWEEVVRRPPQVFVADFHIGDGDSGDLLERIHRLFPRIRCLLVTGSDRAEWSALLERRFVHAALMKPFDLLELMRLVERGPNTMKESQ